MNSSRQYREPLYVEKDGLTDTLVEFMMSSDYKLEFLQSKVYELLPKAGMCQYSAKSRLEKTNQGELVSRRTYLNITDYYKVEVSDNRLIFNITNRYPGWKQYSDFIFGIVEGISEYVKVLGVALRYVSEFPGVDVFSNIQGSIKLDRLNIEGSEYSFSMNIAEGAEDNMVARADVKLVNNRRINRDLRVSNVDISLRTSQTIETRETLRFLHEHEKHLYFMIMSEDFIRQLGPHYE